MGSRADAQNAHDLGTGRRRRGLAGRALAGAKRCVRRAGTLRHARRNDIGHGRDGRWRARRNGGHGRDVRRGRERGPARTLPAYRLRPGGAARCPAGRTFHAAQCAARQIGAAGLAARRAGQRRRTTAATQGTDADLLGLRGTGAKGSAGGDRFRQARRRAGPAGPVDLHDHPRLGADRGQQPQLRPLAGRGWKVRFRQLVAAGPAPGRQQFWPGNVVHSRQRFHAAAAEPHRQAAERGEHGQLGRNSAGHRLPCYHVRRQDERPGRDGRHGHVVEQFDPPVWRRACRLALARPGRRPGP
jgi:hypothetical protein